MNREEIMDHFKEYIKPDHADYFLLEEIDHTITHVQKQTAEDISNLVVDVLSKHTPECKMHMKFITDAIKKKYV